MSHMMFCVVAGLMLLSAILKGIGSVMKQNEANRNEDRSRDQTPF